MGEEVLDADGEVVVGVQQAGGAGDDAVAVVVGVAGPGDVVEVLVLDHAGHGEGRGAVHADFAVPVEGHEAEGGIDVGVEEGDVELVCVDDARPVGDAGSAERIDGELEGGAGERREVDDVGEVGDVGGDVVVALGGGRGEGLGVTEAFDALQFCGDEFVSAVLDPLRGGGVGGAAVGGVVLEAAVLGRVVGGRDDDAVGEIFGAACVVGEDGVRECGGGRVAEGVSRLAAGAIDECGDAVGGEDFERGGEGGLGERVGVHGEKERAGGVLRGAVLDDGLGDGEDVRVVEARCRATSRDGLRFRS